jgi:DNA-binding GntR family transcriptional regulator
VRSTDSYLTQFVRRSTADSAADQIRQAIISGELPMGAPLSEAAIAEKLSISRTPVREAFRQLAQEGLVQLRPFAGANVFRVTRVELRRLAAFREMLENAAVEEAMRLHGDGLAESLKGVVSKMREALAADDSQRYLALDSEFHETILKFAENPLLSAAYQLIASRFAALRTIIASDPARLKRSLASHAALVKLIASRDVETTQEALLIHMRGWEAYMEAEASLQPSLLEGT